MSVKTLYESKNYIVVNKPYDMYINSDNMHEKNTVAYHIGLHDSHLSTSARPLHFVHRLDYATSGVLCIATNKRAAAEAGRVLQNRKAHKYYLAVVRGHVDHHASQILYDIGEDITTATTSHKMMAVTSAECGSTMRGSRAADTRLLLLGTGWYEERPASIVLLKPNTEYRVIMYLLINEGRRHQLRVHCSSIGHNILGDYTYSDGRDSRPHRMFLHSTRLVLPLDSETLDIQTEEPFLSDVIFNSRWRIENTLYSFVNKEQFIDVCNVIDNINVDHVKVYQVV